MGGQHKNQFFHIRTWFYELVFKCEFQNAEKFRDWVFSEVRPSIRKYGYYKLFDNLNIYMFKNGSTL